MNAAKEIAKCQKILKTLAKARVGLEACKETHGIAYDVNKEAVRSNETCRRMAQAWLDMLRNLNPELAAA